MEHRALDSAVARRLRASRELRPENNRRDKPDESCGHHRGQAQGGEGEHNTTLIAGGDKKTQAGHEDEQGPNAFMQPFLFCKPLEAFGERIPHHKFARTL
jgi:hypothetical protein